MKTIRTTDIVRVIAERYDIEQREATAFVNAMVDVMNDALHYEKLVKVKGLGTFKVTTVSSRESIDVTTGERISIEARDKITFTPDTTMRDRVNAPFSQFETVLINEGVDFSEIDARYQNQSEIDIEVKPEPVVEVKPEPVAETQTEPVAETQTEPVASPHSQTVVESISESVAEEKHIHSLVSEHSGQQEPMAVSALQEDDNALEVELRHVRRRFYWLLVAAMLLLLLVGGGSVYIFHQLNQRDRLIRELISAKNEQELQAEDETPQVETPAATPVASESEEIATVIQEQTLQEAAQQQPEEVTAKANYDDDPRIRLGAYRIVGIDRQVTVVRGQTFKMISRAHLGEGMECYMEAVNPGVTTVKEGDTLNIPKLELKRKGR